jgi:hypothetical protein
MSVTTRGVVAIVTLTNNHGVCLGFLLEVLKNYDVVIYISPEGDKYRWIDYYSTLYTFKTVFDPRNIDVKNYLKVIKVTHRDNCLDNEDTLSILHLADNQLMNDKSKKFISITPYVKGSSTYYMFPSYSPVLNTAPVSNIVTFVGYYLNSNIDEDTDRFIRDNLDYMFVFILWGDTTYSNLEKHSNVKVLHSVETNTLLNIVSSSRFVLSKKYINYDRYSGQLGMSISFEKPLIIDSKTAGAYALPGFLFYNNYSEIGKLNLIDDSRYESIVDATKLFKQQTIHNNHSTLGGLLST